MDFYPRPPRGGRLIIGAMTGPGSRFLSTPSARRATLDKAYERKFGIFLSTPSARRATHHDGPMAALQLISIHALREEGDS